jgi:hypothetical protein
MLAEVLEADYLVIGAGAMGVAFADEVLVQDKSAQIIMVDRRSRAGGHWNDAYSYVKLHQPAAFYGVNSEDLGPGGAALVSGTEVLAYYERVMDRLKATGRLRFFPLCERTKNGSFRSLVGHQNDYRVDVRRKVVDATYMKVEVPSVRPPAYGVADGVELVAPNAIPRLENPPSGYVVIGAGKTGIDAVLFLLDRGVDPDAIEWIMPNDAWLLDRARLSPGKIAQGLSQMKAFAEARTVDDLFRSLEAHGGVLRIDNNVWPTKYRCATVDMDELRQLRRVKKIIRMGRVLRLEPGSIILEAGKVSTNEKKLHIDCTADGLAKRGVRPVFQGNRITLQSLAMCQQVFSASVIGYVESRYSDDEIMNELCHVVPHPEVSKDFIACSVATNRNTERWLRAFPRWLVKNRLSILHHDRLWAFIAAAIRMRKFMGPSNENLQKLMEDEFSGAGTSDPVH